MCTAYQTDVINNTKEEIRLQQITEFKMYTIMWLYDNDNLQQCLLLNEFFVILYVVVGNVCKNQVRR